MELHKQVNRTVYQSMTHLQSIIRHHQIFLVNMSSDLIGFKCLLILMSHALAVSNPNLECEYQLDKQIHVFNTWPTPFDKIVFIVYLSRI